MPLFSEHHDQLDSRLHDAPAATAGLMSEIIANSCRRFPSHIERLVEFGAWTDVALALLELELPRWRLRRLVWDDGEWHCALSRKAITPIWRWRSSVLSSRRDALRRRRLGRAFPSYRAT